jgi:hypothetical protein
VTQTPNRYLPARWTVATMPGEDTGWSAGVRLSSSIAFAHRASPTSTLHGHRLELEWLLLVMLGDGPTPMPEHDPLDRFAVEDAMRRGVTDAVAPLMRPVVEAMVDVVLPFWHRTTIMERRDPVHQALIRARVPQPGGDDGALDRVRGLSWWPTLERLARHFTVHLAECCKGMDVDVVTCEWRAEDGLRGTIDFDPYSMKPRQRT